MIKIKNPRYWPGFSDSRWRCPDAAGRRHDEHAGGSAIGHTGKHPERRREQRHNG